MTNEIETTYENDLLQIISRAGSAKSSAYEALDLMADGKFDEAEQLLGKAREMLVSAQQHQFKLITQESQGKPVPFSILLSHALDISITAATEIEMSARLLPLLRRHNR